MTEFNGTNLAVPAQGPVLVPVAGSDSAFPVRRVYCVGRNYLEHIREMKGDERDPPFFFQKPADAIVLSGASVPFPPATEDFQHEVELVLAIGKEGSGIRLEDAASHVYGIAVGIDLTRRDLQLKARNSGRPWESGKSFDHSAPISPIRPLVAGALPASGRITLSVNGAIRQEGDLAEMIWSSAEIVSQLSHLYRLFPGDLIYTGTPAGVGKLAAGDTVVATIEGLDEVRIGIC